MANEALSIDLTDPDVAEAFAEADVGSKCVIKATIASKDENGLTASVDSAEYDGYEYTINEESGAEESKPKSEKPMPMGEESGKPKGKGLVVMVGIGKPKK